MRNAVFGLAALALATTAGPVLAQSQVTEAEEQAFVATFEANDCVITRRQTRALPKAGFIIWRMEARERLSSPQGTDVYVMTVSEKCSTKAARDKATALIVIGYGRSNGCFIKQSAGTSDDIVALERRYRIGGSYGLSEFNRLADAGEKLRYDRARRGWTVILGGPCGPEEPLRTAVGTSGIEPPPPPPSEPYGDVPPPPPEPWELPPEPPTEYYDEQPPEPPSDDY